MINRNLNNLPQNQIPLLLWNNSIEKTIEEPAESKFLYDDKNQIVEIDCVTIGTKSLKNHVTKKGTTQDTVRKNEIDDSKTKK